MSYTAWSVVFGEQPTAAKWNQLGENDAGFKDASNIDDDAIVARHIAANAVLADNIDESTFPDLVDNGTSGNSMNMTIVENGIVIVMGTARIGTATGGVTLVASGTAVVSSRLLQNQQNDADYTHFPVGGFVKVKPGTLTLTIGGVDNKGMVAMFIPVITSASFA